MLWVRAQRFQRAMAAAGERGLSVMTAQCYAPCDCRSHREVGPRF
jgi:hypothetical protein